MVKLNLACGQMYIDGWINVDLYNPKADIKADVKALPFEDNYADEAVAIHIIEHFDFKEGFDVLKEWYRVLKPGGTLTIECPDLLGMCQEFVNLSEPERVKLYAGFYGFPWEDGQAHKFAYTESQLRWTLQSIGFKNIIRINANRYPDLVSWNMGMIATK